MGDRQSIRDDRLSSGEVWKTMQTKLPYSVVYMIYIYMYVYVCVYFYGKNQGKSFTICSCIGGYKRQNIPY